MRSSYYGEAWHARWAFTVPHDERHQCQDCAHAFTAGDLTILVVADGVSAARHAAEGSMRAVQTVLHLAPRMSNLSWTSADEVVDTARGLMNAAAMDFVKWTHRHADPSAYQSTLAFAILYGNWVGIGSVGDSFAVVYSGSSAHIAMPPDRPGESNETYTVEDWDHGARYLAIHDPGLQGVLLSTDGLEKLLIDGIVRSGCGSSVVPMTVHPDFAGVLGNYCDSFDNEVIEQLGSREVVQKKGDDVGVSVAARHVDLARG